VVIVGVCTTIMVSRELKRDLDSFKEFDRETYSQVIQRLIHNAKTNRESDLELSDSTLKAIERARKDVREGKVYTSRQLANELGL
jgi:predicted CopG family antitoxin